MTPPPTAASDAAAVRAVRARAGLSGSEVVSLVVAEGPERVAFLQTQLPADLARLEPGHAVHTAYLDRKGRIVTDLTLLDPGEALWLLFPPERAGSAVETLERHHFRERVTFTDRAEEIAVLEFHGPAVPGILAAAAGVRVPTEPLRHMELSLGGRSVRYLSDPWTGDVGGRLLVARDGVAAARSALIEASEGDGPVEIGPGALEILRLEGGRPRVGIDTDERTLLPELGREDMIARDKGCYLGQETVARIHARGRLHRRLMGLVVEGDRIPPAGTMLFVEDEPAGETRSACFSPGLGKTIALARVRRSAMVPGTVVHLALDGAHVAAVVAEPPLYRVPGPRERAEALYAEGMAAFAADRLDEAAARFERALLMDPARADAYEALGVCQERRGLADEAMETMRGLTEMDPGNVMAWSNLSRYHAERGEIEEAERLKGHATHLLWTREAGAREAARRAEEQRRGTRADLETRLGMFESVLEADPDDVIANFGLGKALMDLDRPEAAVPRFERALVEQPDYSMAFNHLGSCLLRLGRKDEAVGVWRRGIEVAARRGDLAPGRDMQRKLDEAG